MSIDSLRAIDLNLLKIFQAIYDARNITRAAEQIGLTQSAVSHALNRLRKQFNDDLFIRSPEGMMPTLLSDEIAVKCRQILLQTDMLFHHDLDFQPERSARRFVIGIPEYVSFHLLGRLMGVLQKKAPKMRIITTHVNYMSGYQAVNSESVDLAIGHFPEPPKFIGCETLYSEDYVCVGRKKHPALNDLTLQSYLEASHMHFSLAGKDTGQIDSTLRRMGKSRNVQMTVSDYTLGLWILKETDLLYTGPRKITEGMSTLMGLETVDLPFERPEFTVMQMWHKRYEQDQAHYWLRAQIKDLCSEIKALAA